MNTTEKSLALGVLKKMNLLFREKYSSVEIKTLLNKILGTTGFDFQDFLYSCVQLDLLSLEDDFYSITEEAILTLKFLQSLQNVKNKKQRVN
jgi:hypothetical protein